MRRVFFLFTSIIGSIHFKNCNLKSEFWVLNITVYRILRDRIIIFFFKYVNIYCNKNMNANYSKYSEIFLKIKQNNEFGIAIQRITWVIHGWIFFADILQSKKNWSMMEQTNYAQNSSFSCSYNYAQFMFENVCKKYVQHSMFHPRVQ